MRKTYDFSSGIQGKYSELYAMKPSLVETLPSDDHLASLAADAAILNQYSQQLNRLRDAAKQTEMIEDAVKGVIQNLPHASSRSLVIYGDPQSGKTEMMICLTAKLLDDGRQVIVHLMNDNVDLLMQNLDRFKEAGLAPAPRNATDLTNSPLVPGHKAILFCKKNSRDLQKLIPAITKHRPVIVIDDEADYATPNSKINQRKQTRINELVAELLGDDGIYIGVTATPARLNLNNTFNNRTETWVQFKSHDAYTGQDTFFPQTTTPNYRLVLLKGAGNKADAQSALARFLVTVAYLNTSALKSGGKESNYTFLVHTSGKKIDHDDDRKTIESALQALVSKAGDEYKKLLKLIFSQAAQLFPDANTEELFKYVIANASRHSCVVLNSSRDRKSAGDKPTEPTCPFTVIIGGNIVSRGVTFPNLLSMFFTRDVKHKLQQDTYIQRARMFGSRGKYLKYFELTIPEQLYSDWHRCFVFHKLALESIKNDDVSPVWIGDSRISIASPSSIDFGTVDFNKGEMSFRIFGDVDYSELDNIIDSDPTSVATLKRLADVIGDAMPPYLIDFLDSQLRVSPGSLAIHKSSSIEGYGDSADHDGIARKKGFIGKPQLEEQRFPNARHHVKIFYNAKGKGRVFYKNQASVQFVQNELAG